MFLVIAIVLGFLVFASDGHLALIGLAGTREEYGIWLGIAFLVACTTVLVQTVAASGRQGIRWFLAHRLLQQRKRRMWYLTPEECTILAAYVQNNTKTLTLEIADGIVVGLSRANIIYQATSIAHGGQTTAEYNIRLWAWEYLHKHPELLKRHGQVLTLSRYLRK